MKWRGERESDNIEDRRSDGGLGGGGLGGGLGGGGFRGGPLGGGIRLAGGSWKMMLVLVLVVLYFILKMMGIDAGQLLDGGSVSGPGVTQSQSSSSSGGIATDEMTSFVRTVLGTTEDAWTGIFKAQGQT